MASDEKISPNKKTLTYSNIGAYMKRGITLVGGLVKVLHKGCIKQYCVGIFFTWMYLLEMKGCYQGCYHSIYIYIYIYVAIKHWYELMNWQMFSLHYHPDYLGDWLG